MSDTLQNIKLQANTWIDLYSESGIDVGIQLVVENILLTPIYLVEQASKPRLPYGYSKLRETSRFSENDSGALGSWAMSPDTDGLIQVSKAV